MDSKLPAEVFNRFRLNDEAMHFRRRKEDTNQAEFTLNAKAPRQNVDVHGSWRPLGAPMLAPYGLGLCRELGTDRKAQRLRYVLPDCWRGTDALPAASSLEPQPLLCACIFHRGTIAQMHAVNRRNIIG